MTFVRLTKWSPYQFFRTPIADCSLIEKCYAIEITFHLILRTLLIKFWGFAIFKLIRANYLIRCIGLLIFQILLSWNEHFDLGEYKKLPDLHRKNLTTKGLVWDWKRFTPEIPQKYWKIKGENEKKKKLNFPFIFVTKNH